MCVTVINVGYGDAILFQLKNGYTALLDGGSALESEFEGDSYRIRSADYLARQQIEHLNAVIISHIHEDHVCGLEAVLQQTVVDHLYVPYPVEPLAFRPFRVSSKQETVKPLLMLGGFLFDAYIAITNFREVSRILRTSIKRE